MKAANRDLLVLSKKASPDPVELEHEVEQLHELLYHVESMFNFCQATQVIDVNKCRIIVKPHRIQRIIHTELKPFQFLHNKN